MKQTINKQDIKFAMIANSVLNDKRLSWKAKGIFAYLYSKPENWDFSMLRFQSDSTDKIKSTRAGIKELEACGYVVRKKLKSGKTSYLIMYKPSVQKGNLPNWQLAKKASIRKKEVITKKEYIDLKGIQRKNTSAVAKIVDKSTSYKPTSSRRYGNMTSVADILKK